MLDVVFDFFKDLTRKDDHGGSAITNFSVLRTSDVCEDTSCRMDDIEELGRISNVGEVVVRRLAFMTVAPSLVIVCRPFVSTNSRSPPYGPRVLLIVA